MNDNKDQQILYYDDECNLCHLSKEFYEIRDPEKKTLFVPISELKSDERKLPDHFSPSSGVILYQNGKFYHKSEAILRSLKQLPGWKWLYWLNFLPKWLRDFIYDLVAKYRYRVFGKRDSSP